MVHALRRGAAALTVTALAVVGASVPASAEDDTGDIYGTYQVPALTYHNMSGIRHEVVETEVAIIAIPHGSIELIRVNYNGFVTDELTDSEQITVDVFEDGSLAKQGNDVAYISGNRSEVRIYNAESRATSLGLMLPTNCESPRLKAWSGDIIAYACIGGDGRLEVASLETGQRVRITNVSVGNNIPWNVQVSGTSLMWDSFHNDDILAATFDLENETATVRKVPSNVFANEFHGFIGEFLVWGKYDYAINAERFYYAPKSNILASDELTSAMTIVGHYGLSARGMPVVTDLRTGQQESLWGAPGDMEGYSYGKVKVQGSFARPRMWSTTVKVSPRSPRLAPSHSADWLNLPSVSNDFTLSGVPQVGVEVVGGAGAEWVGDDLTFLYAWYLNGEPIPGADTDRYTPTVGQAGGALMFEATAISADGLIRVMQTPPITVLGVGAPVNVFAPSMTDPVVGAVVNGSAGQWTGEDVRYLFAWYLDGEWIEGADQALFTPTADMAGHELRFEVTAVNDSGAVSIVTDAKTVTELS